MRIPFNIPFSTDKELNYIQEAIDSGQISGNGMFTRKYQRFIEKNYGFKNPLFTTSCTDVLEMSTFLLDIKHGDKIIIPSYIYLDTIII